MPGRILTMQRQVREIGRLRTGFTGPKGPVRSKTWILTGKDQDLLQAAAALWGGEVVSWVPLNGTDKQWSLTTETAVLPAFLPPGDPLTQANEIWSKGGATRRCNGIVESKSGKPCLCAAAFGEEWYTRDAKEVCRPYSQLNLMLLQLPDLGVFRHVTKSYYAAGELAGQVDLIKARVGIEPIVPVWLIIDPRKKVADGKTTPYPVPVIKIRGAESGAALLAGRVPTLELGAGSQPLALESGQGAGPLALEGPATDSEPAKTKLTPNSVMALVPLTKNVEQLQQLWRDAKADGALNEQTAAALEARSAALQSKPSAGPAATEPIAAELPIDDVPPADAPVDGEVEPDPDAMWAAINGAAGRLKWSADHLETLIQQTFNKSSADINGFQMRDFLRDIKSGAVK